ncbi:polysaccharide pyruvyl transferase family protein [Ideonella sp.]|uniref:polysaccharide pyruvyl transferase family protein n=1 Tax=Ideonella sp. TaxID=1929293 RepID=UPI0035AFC5FB
MPEPHDMPAPMLVSFAYGDAYYLQAAERLADDCTRLGVACHIERPALPAGTSWIDACRHKVRFLADCCARFDRPLWWVDVDCRLLRPLPLLGPAIDLGFFLRGFRDLRQYDPALLPRTAQPSILYLGATPAAHAFVALMAEREQAHVGSATDDWFLQEAWTGLPQMPAVTVFPPGWVRLDDEPGASTSAVFDFGRSGHAAEFKGQAAQHEVELFTPPRRKALFMREVSEALRDGRGSEATFFLRKAQQADPADEALAWRVARGWQREGRLDEAERVLRALPATAQGSDHLTRFHLDVALDAGQDVQAEWLAQQLRAGECTADRAWADSRLLRIGLARRARQARLRPAQRPQLWWMEGPYPGNFGDILNPYLVERLTGLPPLHSPKGTGVLAIGSTVRFAREGTVVWGAGTPRMSDRLDPRARYLAVRGPLTAELVRQCGGQAPEVLGDPACLLPRVYTPRPAATRHRLGVVLHHAHEGRVQVTGDAVAIGVLRAGYEGIEAFVDELCACDRVLTSSLHGLIVAHAYGIPAQWFTVLDAPDAVPGDGTKFRDYLLSVGLPDAPPLVVAAGSRIDPTMAAGAVLPPRPLDGDRLLAVAPWRLAKGWRR